MIQVSVLYPNGEATKFDIAYYCNQHIPMVKRLLGAAVKSASVQHGIGGLTPGSKASYVAMGHLVFDSVEAFHTSFGPHAEQIVGDIPNYTNTQPIIQVSEIKI